MLSIIITNILHNDIKFIRSNIMYLMSEECIDMTIIDYYHSNSQ